MGGSSLQEGSTCAGCLTPSRRPSIRYSGRPMHQVESTQLEKSIRAESSNPCEDSASLLQQYRRQRVRDRNAEISSYPRSCHARRIGCTERRYAIDRPRAHELSLLRLALWSNARQRRRMRRRPSLTSRMVRLRRSSVFQPRSAIRWLPNRPWAIWR